MLDYTPVRIKWFESKEAAQAEAAGFMGYNKVDVFENDYGYWGIETESGVLHTDGFVKEVFA